MPTLRLLPLLLATASLSALSAQQRAVPDQHKPATPSASPSTSQSAPQSTAEPLTPANPRQAPRPETTAPPRPTPTEAEVLHGAYGPFRSNNDLLYYRLDVKVDPVAKTIAGSNLVRFRMLEDGSRIQLDLTPDLTLDEVTFDRKPLLATRVESAIFLDFPRTLRSGGTYEVVVHYHGHPVSKGRFGGMSFETDPAGRPWIFTADEDDGCSIYWPCKDQWQDEPQDGMDLRIAVPDALTAVSNGRFVSKQELHDGYTRWDWHVSYPINSYDVALNIGTYSHFAETYRNPAFPPLSMDFYALPEDLAKARVQFGQANGMLDAFEHFFGEYPFARDGYKLIQVPYAGMEHQSAVAYGNGFTNGYLNRDWTGVGISPRFDFIIIHESGHEWFGNSVTAKDRSDMWIHEGWDTYLETLYVEYMYGKPDALKYISGLVPKVHNRTPILTERGASAEPPQDMYFKGALMIASLRSWLETVPAGPVAASSPWLGTPAAAAHPVSAADARWFQLLHDFYQHFKYQTILTDDVVAWWNAALTPVLHLAPGQDLTPFFNQYLRHADIPALELNFNEAPGTVLYKWQAEEPAFAMPIRVGAAGTDPAGWQVLRPTTTWQVLKTPLTSEQLQVATGLFYVNVSKT